MHRNDLVIRLLERHWPEECEAAGPTYVQEIVEGNTAFVPVEGASAIDLSTVLTILAAAVALINDTLSIYTTLTEQRGRKADIAALRQEMQSRLPAGTDPAVLEGLYAEIVEAVDSAPAKDEGAERQGQG